MRWHSVVGWSALTLTLAGGAVLLASKRLAPGPSAAMAKDDVPVAAVKLGDIDLNVHATGELRASHMVMLTAPSVGGGSLAITQQIGRAHV